MNLLANFLVIFGLLINIGNMIFIITYPNPYSLPFAIKLLSIALIPTSLFVVWIGEMMRE